MGARPGLVLRGVHCLGVNPTQRPSSIADPADSGGLPRGEASASRKLQLLQGRTGADSGPGGSRPRSCPTMNLLKAASTVSLLTLASRITGLVREQIMAASFGASAATDAFNVAFRIPNLLRRLFAEGAFSQAFVPLLAASRGVEVAVVIGGVSVSRVQTADDHAKWARRQPDSPKRGTVTTRDGRSRYLKPCWTPRHRRNPFRKLCSSCR